MLSTHQLNVAEENGGSNWDYLPGGWLGRVSARNYGGKATSARGRGFFGANGRGFGSEAEFLEKFFEHGRDGIGLSVTRKKFCANDPSEGAIKWRLDREAREWGVCPVEGVKRHPQ